MHRCGYSAESSAGSPQEPLPPRCLHAALGACLWLDEWEYCPFVQDHLSPLAHDYIICITVLLLNSISMPYLNEVHMGLSCIPE